MSDRSDACFWAPGSSARAVDVFGGGAALGVVCNMADNYGFLKKQSTCRLRSDSTVPYDFIGRRSSVIRKFGLYSG